MCIRDSRDRGQFICCFTQQAQPDFKGALMDSTMVLFDAKHTDKGQISRNVVTEEQEECFERYMKMGAMCFLVISLEFEEFYSCLLYTSQQIRATYSQRISEAENRRKYRLDRISEIRQQEEFMKNSGCPDIDGASCRFLAKAIDDVKSLPEEADHLEKCEEEIAALRIKRDEEISKKQDEICVIGYDAERLDLLTTKARCV